MQCLIAQQPCAYKRNCLCVCVCVHTDCNIAHTLCVLDRQLARNIRRISFIALVHWSLFVVVVHSSLLL